MDEYITASYKSKEGHFTMKMIATIVTHRILSLVEHDHIGLPSTSAATSPHAAGLQQKICIPLWG